MSLTDDFGVPLPVTVCPRPGWIVRMFVLSEAIYIVPVLRPSRAPHDDAIQLLAWHPGSVSLSFRIVKIAWELANEFDLSLDDRMC